MAWDINSVALGDYIEVRIVNKRGDRNLDGAELHGRVVELVPSHDMVRLDSGWCAHGKDDLIKHAREED